MAETLTQEARDDVTAKWVPIITAYERSAEKWEKAGRKIVKRYKDERNTRENTQSRYNILWSNVETLKPALFAKSPKAEVERRFKDKDPVGRAASMVLERCIDYELSQHSFGSTMRQSVLDYLLPGRGVTWARYVPHMRDMDVTGQVSQEGSQITEDAEVPEKPEEKPQEVYYEEVISDYVHWQDFGHSECRTWEECDAVWRKVYLTREKLEERFGAKKAKDVPLDFTPKGLDGQGVTDAVKKATIYEIWDKNAKEAIWLSKHWPTHLDRRSDPLRLDKFFPCPRPLLTTTGNDSLLPVADYIEYQDQADELDQLTGRIASLTKAVKAAGVYDASAEGIGRLLNEGVENTLIAIDKWAGFAEKGGLKASMELLPMQEIAQTLLNLYEAREKVKQDLYEITGMADIIRGANDPRSTATAEKIKSNFVTMRLDERQREVQRFTRNVVEIIGQIIAGHFSLETIKLISGVQLLTQQEKQQLGAYMQQMQAQPPQPGMAPMPPPPEEKVRLMDQPTWEEVYALLQNDTARCFRIDIETDSTIAGDEQAAKQDATEFMQAVVPFMEQVFQAPPGLAPLMGEMLMAIVRAFSFGKSLEGAMESALEKFEEQAKKPPAPPPPDPKLAKVQADQATDQAQIQADQKTESMRLQADQAAQQADRHQEAMLEQLRQQREDARAAQEAHASAAQAQQDRMFSLFETKLQEATKVLVANIAAKAQADAAATSAAAAEFTSAETT